MKILLVGSHGYWGSKLLRVCKALGHDVAGEINLSDGDGRRLIAQCAKMSGATAAVIATPAETHAAMLAAALDADLDVLVEKPLAVNARDAASLAALAKRKERVISVDCTFVHSTVCRWLRDHGPWMSYQSLRLGDGPDRVVTPTLWDLVVHDVAILRALGLVGVESESRAVESADRLTAMVWLRLNNGGEAFINAGRAWMGKRSREITLRHADGAEYLWDEFGLNRAGKRIVGEPCEVLRNVVADFADRCERRALNGLTDIHHGVAVCGILGHLSAS